MKKSSKKTFIQILLAALFSIFLLLGACTNNDVVQESVTEFYVYSTAITLEEGDEQQIEFDKTEGASLQFNSADTNVATVSDAGLVLGVNAGVTVVKIACGEESVNCKVTVIPDSYVMSIGYETLTLSVGSSKEFTATVKDGDTVITDGISWQLDKTEGATVVANGHKAIFMASAIGDYILTATCGELVQQCAIRVISTSVTRLETPELSVNGCSTLTWSPVSNAQAYAVSANGIDWTETKETVADVSSVTAGMLNGETAAFYVKALAKNNYELVDSYIADLVFAHEYEGAYTEGKEATCTQSGEINYTCKNCNKSYKDSNYLAEHNYVSWQCSVCKAYRSDVVYAYDGNYIPIPTDADAKDENSAWRVKYKPYYENEVYKGEGGKSFSSENLWETVEKNKEQIPEEEREQCYYVSGIGNSSLKEVYVAGYWRDERFSSDMLPVKYVHSKAFAYNKVIEKIVFSKETTEFRGIVFDNSRVKTVIAPGITYLYDYQCEDYAPETRLNFRNCFSLETVVVGENIIAKGRQFCWWDFKSPWFDGYTAKIKLYIDREYNDMNGFEFNLNGDGQLYRNDLFSGNYYFKDSTGEACNTWRYNDEGTDVVFNAHNFINGRCTKCGGDDPKGINYLYDGEKDCYYVAAGAYTGKVVIQSTYNDGVHGKREVKYLAEDAFKYNRDGSHRKGITHVYLPETVTEIGSFELCLNLQLLSMPAVKRIDVANAFLDCYRLDTLIIGDALSVTKQCFYVRSDNKAVPYAQGYESLMTIYSTKQSAVVGFTSKNDNIWNGIVLPYHEDGEKCETWHWDENGYPAYTKTHNYVQGYCKYCGTKDAQGFTYLYDAETDSYYLHSAASASGVVRVYETYDDGEHGEKPVTRVSKKAFYANADITHLYLPETVTEIGAFELCYKLKFISMPGVKKITEINTFLDCYSLETVVIGSKLSVEQQSFLVRNYEEKGVPEAVKNYVSNMLLTFYTTEQAASVSLHPNDNMWNGKIYAYDEGAIKCGTWCWTDENREEIKVNTDVHDYDEATGECSNCPTYNTYGIIYTLSENGDSYTVTGYDSSTPIVKVYAEYEGKPVTAIVGDVFVGNKTLKELYLPETITAMPRLELCSNLEVLSMPGVTDLHVSTSGNYALRCTSLKTLIVGSRFIANGQIFLCDGSGYVAQMTIYSTATSGATVRFYDNNNMWNGTIVYYDENGACGTWNWTDAKQMGTVVNEGEHAYNVTTGICPNCGMFNACGLTYTENGNEYTVTAYDGVTPIVKIYAEYNGKPVTSITGNIFADNKALIELYLPETITAMPKLELCSKLEILSMPGVTKVQLNPEGNYALRCYALKILIVGESFTVSGQVFHCDKDTYVAQMTIYSTAASNCSVSFDTSLNGSYPRNNMWNGTIVYYSEDATENTWKWSEDGMGIVTNEALENQIV